MDGAMPGQPFLVHHKHLEEHAVPSGSDHTRTDGYMSQNRGGESRSQDDAAQETQRKRSSRICKMEVKKRQEEEIKAEEEAEAERRAEEKRVARQRRKQEREQQQGIEEQQRRMQGIHPDMPAHPDGVAYMVPAGPHMMAGPQQMRANMPNQQQSAARMHGGGPWPAAGGARPNGSSDQAGTGPANGVKQEPHMPSGKGRTPSGWTPVATKKLARNCFGPRSTKRRKPRRNRLKMLTQTAQSWNLPDVVPATAGPSSAQAAAGGSRAAQRPPAALQQQTQQAQQQQQQHQSQQHAQQQQAAAASAGANQRYLEVSAELSRRQQETAAQLNHLVAEQRISHQSANIKMSEVKQLSQMTLQLTMAHPNLSLQQLISMAQNIIHTRQQQAEQQQQAAMASQLHSHPVFARLSPEQQRQLSTMQPHQIRQVLTNLAQNGSLGQIPSPTAQHGAQQPMHMVPTQMSHSMPNQGQMMQTAPTSMPPGMMMPPGMHPQMHAPQQQAQQAQQQQAAAMQNQQRMQGIPQSMPPGSQSGGYPMQQMNPMDDPLMTTLH